MISQKFLLSEGSEFAFISGLQEITGTPWKALSFDDVVSDSEFDDEEENEEVNFLFCQVMYDSSFWSYIFHEMPRFLIQTEEDSVFVVADGESEFATEGDKPSKFFFEKAHQGFVDSSLEYMDEKVQYYVHTRAPHLAR